MKSGLTFLPRDTRDHSSEAIADQRYQWMKGKTLQHILIDCFLKNYGYEKGIVTATAIVLVDKIIASLKEPLFIDPRLSRAGSTRIVVTGFNSFYKY